MMDYRLSFWGCTTEVYLNRVQGPGLTKESQKLVFLCELWDDPCILKYIEPAVMVLDDINRSGRSPNGVTTNRSCESRPVSSLKSVLCTTYHGCSGGHQQNHIIIFIITLLLVIEVMRPAHCIVLLYSVGNKITASATATAFATGTATVTATATTISTTTTTTTRTTTTPAAITTTTTTTTTTY